MAGMGRMALPGGRARPRAPPPVHTLLPPLIAASAALLQAGAAVPAPAAGHTTASRAFSGGAAPATIHECSSVLWTAGRPAGPPTFRRCLSVPWSARTLRSIPFECQQIRRTRTRTGMELAGPVALTLHLVCMLLHRIGSKQASLAMPGQHSCGVGDAPHRRRLLSDPPRPAQKQQRRHGRSGAGLRGGRQNNSSTAARRRQMTPSHAGRQYSRTHTCPPMISHLSVQRVLSTRADHLPWPA